MANCSLDDSRVALKQNGCVLGEAVKLSGLSHCNAAAFELQFSQVPWQLHTHMSTAGLKDTLILLTSVRKHNLPTSCCVLSCLLIARPSQIRTIWNATFSEKPFQMTPVSTNGSIHYPPPPTRYSSTSIFCLCTPSISMRPFSFGLNKIVLDLNFLRVRMSSCLFCIHPKY